MFEKLPNACYIKWYHWLWLWLLPTHKSYDQDQGCYVYCKHFRGHIYVVKIDHIIDKHYTRMFVDDIYGEIQPKE